MDEICTSTACITCDGRGYVFKNVLWACKSCLGLGQKLTPKADPAKMLQ
jgi:DnaJ-class molecular chaperone